MEAPVVGLYQESAGKRFRLRCLAERTMVSSSTDEGTTKYDGYDAQTLYSWFTVVARHRPDVIILAWRTSYSYCRTEQVDVLLTNRKLHSRDVVSDALDVTGGTTGTSGSTGSSLVLSVVCFAWLLPLLLLLLLLLVYNN